MRASVSDAKLAALGVSQDDMLGRIRKAVSFAAGEGITVAFFGVDGSRAESRPSPQKALVNARKQCASCMVVSKETRRD